MSARRYIAVVQAAEGYPPPGAPLEKAPPEGPAPPEIIDEVPATELARGEVPRAEDPRPWFGLHNVVQELVSVGCYVCEQPYSDEAEAAGCPGDPNGKTLADLRLPEARFGLSTVGTRS